MNNKDIRKQIRDELRFKALKEFQARLPMSQDQFKNLFDYLDLAFEHEKCNDDHALTIRFLNITGINNVEDVIKWLTDHNGFCDCEVLANVEEQFEFLWHV
ncbi:DUF2695 domain-containing protein [Pedobacter soli]|uniref:DUF2695 domain-containing protein n=1 Tax=Pedobacter soli TaxID=390242 RepID=A0A1G6Q2X4_9SPHI|nr:DUF2695 domain-containing protein [Pedobacter soli]SDC86802.1 Protein of unknown function [Pedobacter soli]